MKAQRYKIEKYANKGSWNAGWETLVDYGYCLTAVKKQAAGLAKEHPMWDIRIKAENGGVYWEYEFKQK